MLKEELKKIWRPGMVLALVLLGSIYYTMFLHFYIQYFPNGSQYEGMFEVAKQMLKTYGTSLSESEMAEFESGIPLLQKEADRYVAESETGRKYGLKTYEQYSRFWQKVLQEAAESKEGADRKKEYADAMILGNYLQGEGTDNIEGRLSASSLFAAQYDAEKNCRDIQPGISYTKKEREHAKQAFFGSGEAWQNILPPEVPQAAGCYAGRLLVWICLSVCLMLSPLSVRDRMSRMMPLQYSSRCGRKIYKSQLAAVMLSAILLTTASIALFGAIFAVNGTSVFFPCRMYSFMSGAFCWPQWTHGTWCLVLAAMCYLTAAGTAGTVFFLARGCGNYIGMMLKVVPLFVAMAVLCPKIMEDAFYYQNELYQYTKLPYSELICAAAVFAAGVLLCLIGSRRVKKETV